MKTLSNLESLEPKIAPAGLVTVTYTPATGAIVFAGDGLNNQVELSSPAPGTFQVDDNFGGGTLFSVNGSAPAAGPVIFAGALIGNLTSNLQGGDDTLRLETINVSGFLSVTETTGAGLDTLAFNSTTIAGNATINLGAGNDLMPIGGTVFSVGGSLNVQLDTGNDSVTVAGSVSASLGPSTTINLGTGSNTLAFNPGSYTAGSLTVTNAGAAGFLQSISISPGTTGSFSSFVNITNSAGNAVITAQAGTSLTIGGGLTVNSSTGTDSFTTARLTAGTTLINLGGGVSLTDSFSHTAGNLTLGQLTYGAAATSNGTDTVSITGTSFSTTAGLATFNVGTGDNTVTIAPSGAGVGEGVVTIAASLNVNGGVGTDTLSITPTTSLSVGANLAINLGDGLNSATVTSPSITVSSGGTTSYTGASGNDSFILSGTTAALGTVTVTTGTGANSINVNPDNLTAGSVTFTNAGSPGVSQTLSLGAAGTISGLSMVNSNGDAAITLGGEASALTINGNSTVTAVGGNDTMTLRNLTTANQLTINLGGGNNILNSVVGSTLTVPSFNYGNNVAASGNDTLTFLGAINSGSAGTFQLNLGSGVNAVTFSGNVNVDASLTITGLAGSDTMTIDAASFDVAAGTTFNLGDGTNRLTVTSATLFTAGSLAYTGGSSDDNIAFSGANADINGTVILNVGNGNNEATFWNTTTDMTSFSYTGGTGLDIIELGDFELGGSTLNINGNVTVTMGNGVNAIGINGASITGGLNATSINSRRLLADEVAVYSSTIDGAVNINLGTGTSIIDFQSVTIGGPVIANTGAGNDIVLLDQASEPGTSVFNSSVSINLGSGDDFLTAGAFPTQPNSGNTFNGYVVIDGGSGNDTAYILDPASPPAAPGSTRGNIFNSTKTLISVEAQG